MSKTELTLSFVAVGWLFYAIGVQTAAKKALAASYGQAVPADPLEWLTGWAQ